MKNITENKAINDTYFPCALINSQEKIYINKVESYIKTNTYNLKEFIFDYIKREKKKIEKVLNKKNIDRLLNNYKVFFENYRILFVLSILNTLIILFPFLLFLLLVFVTSLPVFFLFFSLFFFFFPVLYPLIKDKVYIIYKEEIIFGVCTVIGISFFFISVLFICLIPFVYIFLYPFIGIFIPLVSTLILPLIVFVNIVIYLIYVILYIEVFSNVKK
ncbi:conserved Plasmodium membrane protein, unknown function [Plasmodium relictum]|uniref:Uncharacterized protein n=1 Tax=Plasmodium relictum TaxID=85471 RepID=A0A1J1HDF6_PLARL|nr:conserved Plasmodium membrane protein, unknown function [Plasmodium relictum]CRH01619.1 conserved Plasmodium membrane protein, unknown function [Plasmodium relictum]